MVKYIAGGQDYRKVLVSQFSEEVNGGGEPTLGEAERTAGEKRQVEVEARGLGQTRGLGKRQRKGVSGGLSHRAGDPGPQRRALPWKRPRPGS